MTNSKALVIQSGVTKQIPDADTLIVSAGIRSATGSALTVTADTGSITMASATSFSSTATVTGAINANGGIQRSTVGAMNIGTTSGNTTSVNIGTDTSVTGTITLGHATSGGFNTTVAGNLTVNGTETVIGATVFQTTVVIGDGVGGPDTFAFDSTTGRLGSSVFPHVNWLKEESHNFIVDVSTTSGASGGSLNVRAGAGTAGSGATAGGVGGALSGVGGAGGAGGTSGGGGLGGVYQVVGGVGGIAGTTTGVAGAGGGVTVQGGTGGASVASAGAAASGGALSVLGGTGGAGSTANDGLAGGATSVTGGTGGIGAASRTGGIGGAISVTGGTGGAAGGGTAGNGGNVTIDAGTGASNGLITLGTTNSTSTSIGRTTGSASTSVVGAPLTLTSNGAATWSTSAGALTINGTAGVNLQGGGVTVMAVNSAGTTIIIQPGVTMSFSGTGNINLPNNASSRFNIEGAAVTATVTAANLTTLTNGSNADALHTHSSSGAANVQQAYIAGEAIDAGELVALYSGAGTPVVIKADANGAITSRFNVIGVANNAASGAGPSVTVLMAGERSIPDAEWDSFPTTSDVGSRVYLSETAGNWTLTAPTTAGSWVLKTGIVSQGGTGAVKTVVQIGEGILL